MKKLFTITLALALALSPVTPVFAAVQDINGAGANCDANCVAEGVTFTTNHTLTIDDDAAVGNTAGASFNPGTDDFGTVAVTRDVDVSGTVGTGGADSINEVNLTVAGTDLTLSADSWLAGDFNLGAATESIILEAGADITTGAATSITNAVGSASGTLTAQGASVISGHVGGAGVAALSAINVGAAGTTSTFNGDAFVTTLSITSTGQLNSDSITGTTVNFAGNGTISVDTAENVTAAVTTSTTNTGTLTLEGATTVSGAVGASGAALSTVNVGVDATASVFTSTIHATTINITGDATNVQFAGDVTGTLDFDAGSDPTAITFTSGSDLTGSVTSNAAADGQLTFSGTSTVTGAIGSNANYINSITANGAGETLAFGGNVFADVFSQGAANTLNLGTNTLDLDAAATGAFTMDAAGTLKLTINSSSVFGNVDVNNAGGGAVTMAAGNAVNVTVAGAVTNGQTFLVIDGTSGIAALPGTVTDNSALISFTATEPAAGDLLLTAAVNTTGLTGPSTTTLNAALAGPLSSDLNTAVGTILANSSAANADTAIATLDPVVDSGVPTISNEIVAGHVETIVAHLDEVAQNDSDSGQSGVSSGEAAGSLVWIKGFGSFLDQDTRGGVDGYDASVGGALIGFDDLVGDSFRMGLGGGWSAGNVDADSSADETDLNSYQGTVYARYSPDPWYVDASFTFSYNEYEGTRNISLNGTTISRIATSDYEGQQYSGFFGVGYNIKDAQWGPGFTITPLASLHYIHTDIDGYSEEGAGGLNLNVTSQDYDFLQSGVGARISWAFNQDWGVLVPEVHAKYLYDFIGDEAQTTSSFAGGGSTFTTTGFDPAQHAFNAGAGLEIIGRGNTSLQLNYDLEAREDFIGHYGSATLKIRF